MATYYDYKRRAVAKMRQLIQSGQSIDRIELVILENFGFGTMFVQRYLEKLEKLGHIEIVGDTPKWIGGINPEKSQEEFDAVLGVEESPRRKRKAKKQETE